MRKKTVSRILLTMLSVGVLTLAINLEPAKAQSFYFNLEIAVTPEFPTSLDDITITVSFDLIGMYGVTFSSVSQVDNEFFVYIDIYVPEIQIPVITPVEHDYDLGKLPVGSYSFTASVTVSGWGWGGGSHSKSFTVATPVHDTAVTNIMNSKTVVGQGYCVDVAVVVENQGKGGAESFNVTAYYSSEVLTWEQWEIFWSMGDVDRDGYIDMIDADLLGEAFGSALGDPNYNPDCDFDQDGYVGLADYFAIVASLDSDIWTYFNIQGGSISRHVVTDLSAADSTTLVFTWNSTDVPYGNYTIGAKSLRVTGETNITNNAYDDGWGQVTFPGDVDGDGDVDTADLSDIRTGYGSTYGSPDWNANFDVNGDSKIDVIDLFIQSKNFGRIGP